MNENISFKINFLKGLKDNSKSKYLVKTNKLGSDPLTKLFSSYEEIQCYGELNKMNYAKELYLKVSNIHQIFYDYNIIHHIKSPNQTLTELYFLAKLIEISKNKCQIDFSFNFSFIQEIYKKYESENESIRKLILSKIILELINNYNDLDILIIDEIKKEILAIENACKLNISKSIKLLKEICLNLDEKEIEIMGIEDLYVEIAYCLIKNDNKKCKEISKILNQMGLDSIDISKKIYEKYLKPLFDNYDYNNIKQYQIKEGRYLNKKIINFYYILFNYILKDSLYIYENQFLLQGRKTFINIIIKKRDNLRISSEIFSKKRKKLECLIKKFLDCDFYKEKADEYLNEMYSSKKEKKNIPKICYIKCNKVINNINYELFYPEDIKKLMNIQSNINSTKVSCQNFQRSNIKNSLDDFKEVNNEENLYSNLTTPLETYHNKLDNKDLNNNDKITCLKEITNDHLYFEENNSIQFIDYYLINKKWNKIKIFDESRKEIQINNYVIAFINNNFIDGKENELIFFNKSNDSIIRIINGYSFSLGLIGCDVINNEIIMCPCKKYTTGQKNGFLLASYKNKKILFKDTYNFKVYCICQLLNKVNKKSNYFLVSGFEGKAKLKLYKLIEVRNKDLDIDFLDEIFIDDSGFLINLRKPINSIKQSKVTGHLFFYLDKKVYIFSQPNLSKYLYMEEKRKIDSRFESYDIKGENENNYFYEHIYDDKL